MDERVERHEFGFLRSVHKPSAEELRTYYAETYYQAETAQYRKQYPEDELAYLRLKLAQEADLIDKIRGGRSPGTMLDVGCGEGFALDWFMRHGWNGEGLDHSIAGIRAMHPHLEPVVETGDLFALLDAKIAAGSQYDLLVLNNVLEHVTDPVGLLKALRRLVPDDGVMLIAVPNDGSRYHEMLYERGLIAERFWIAIPDHLSYFTYDSLKTTVEAAGWNCEDIIADFPIDFFLMHEGSNYVGDRASGPAAHRARIIMELLLGELPHEQVNEYYRAMAKVGLGRSITAILTPGGGVAPKAE